MHQSKAEILGPGIISVKGRKKGPTVGIIATIHGIELCGRKAAQNILRDYEIERGRLVLVDGNPEATILGRRFVDGDMNRMFTERTLSSKGSQQDLVRARYLAEFLPTIGIDFAVDCHSVSSRTPRPFAISFPGTEELVQLCPMARIYGWRGIVKGTLAEWLCNHGTPTVVIEAGQHEAAASVRQTERTLVSVLARHGVITPKKPVPARRQQAFDVVENVQIADPDTFAFHRDYASFDALEPGEKIATDAKRTYRVPPEEGFTILMPTTMEVIRNGTAAGAYYLMRERKQH